MLDHEKRLKEFLSSRGEIQEFESLTADASTRGYFRISWKGAQAIACVYPEKFDPAEQSYIDVTKLFVAGGLPVAEIFDFDGEFGVIVQEDLGDVILRNVLLDTDSADHARKLDEAISLIARIQTVTGLAYEMNSIASKLKFDEEKLLWELNFFKEHYFQTFRRSPLSPEDDAALTAEFEELATELESYATVLCHRDFHAANLMIDQRGRMRIIDHQDARIGSPAYDLVSLLLDRITEPPSREWLAEKRRYFLNVRRRLGLPALDEENFANEFRLQTLQRCLKAAGTFSFQAINRGKTYFVPFIKPMFRITCRSAESLNRFPVIREILGREID
ncbi:MAG TPA: phosphotransferase [Pyrinomonadaceae bacterium]|nr:phosphotransferase [Acidobacteriota bacterium]HQZ96842.1 phosphotransferase [Pyrinomonadaceae bacterium]